MMGGGRAILFAALFGAATGCLVHERDGPRDPTEAGAVDAGAADAWRSVPLDGATWDVPPRASPDGCVDYVDQDGGWTPVARWDAGGRTGSPSRAAAIVDDGVGFGLVWEDWSDLTIRFARVDRDGRILAHTSIAPGGGGRIYPAIGWNGERFGVAFQSGVGAMSWAELSTDAVVITSGTPQASDICSFHRTMLWSGDRWTRMTTAESSTHAVITQMFPDGSSRSHVIDEIEANACDTISAAWDGTGFAVTWSDWTEAGHSRMRFARLDRDGMFVVGSDRTLGDDPGEIVEGFYIVWTGTDFVAFDGGTRLLHLARDGTISSSVPVGDPINGFFESLVADGCGFWMVDPNYVDIGFRYVSANGTRVTMLEGAQTGDSMLALGDPGEAGFVVSSTFGVVFARVTPTGILGGWRAISTAASP